MDHASLRFLDYEARALLTRLDRVKPFALQMTSVPAAAISVEAQAAVERVLAAGRRELRERVGRFLVWLSSAAGHVIAPAVAQRRFALLRLRFNAVLGQVDLFADALVQRSEQEHGAWLGGLDMLARDALALPGWYPTPPLVCYLDRGAGAAIRRLHTRLPGGGENPVALIRVPRERMIGSGIASSVIHETGHQADALLDLTPSFRSAVQERARTADSDPAAWQCWERWMSEIVADLWAIARVGVTSTVGLIGVVSLPRSLVFRVTPGDPHPMPWIRVRLSCAIGQALFPDPQWERLRRCWESWYPRTGLPRGLADLVDALERTLPRVTDLLISHRPPRLGRLTLPELLDVRAQAPARLRALWRRWRRDPESARVTPPALGFAVIGQARADEAITPAREGEWLRDLLVSWAVRDALGARAEPRFRGVFEAGSLNSPIRNVNHHE